MFVTTKGEWNDNANGAPFKANVTNFPCSDSGTYRGAKVSWAKIPMLIIDFSSSYSNHV